MPTDRQSSKPAPDEGPFPSSHGPTPFVELMTAVTHTVRKVEGLEGAFEEDLNRFEEHFERTVQDLEKRGIEIPPQVLHQVRRGIAMLRRLPQPLVLSDLHPIVVHLLWRNYEDLKSSLGMDGAKKAMTATLRMFTQRPRGRPRQTSVADVVDARRLQKRGESYAGIGRKTNRSRDEVRNAIRHTYRKRKLR